MSLAGSAGCSSSAAWQSSSPGGAVPHHHKRYRNENDQHQAAKSKCSQNRADERQIVAEKVAGEPDRGRPPQGTQRAEQLEAPERHPRHAGEHGSPRAQPEDETAGEDGLVAMPCEEKLRSRDVVGSDAKEAAKALDERPAAPIAEVIADVRAHGGAEEAEQDD